MIADGSSPASAGPARRSPSALGRHPDVFTLGKALGGGILPVSAVVADSDILGYSPPARTVPSFGGNPLAAAVGHRR